MGRIIAIAATGPLLAWLSMSFIVWDFDPSSWDVGVRVITLSFAPVGSAALAALLSEVRP